MVELSGVWTERRLEEFLDESRIPIRLSTNHPPYRGIRGNGTAATSPDKNKATLRALVERYLGGTDSALAEWLLTDERDEVRIRIQPHEIYSWDYTDRMRGIEHPSTR